MILSGAILGITAALLWSAHGVVVSSYPLEKHRVSFCPFHHSSLLKLTSFTLQGRAFALVWGLFNGGAVIGSTIAFVINQNSGGLGAVKTSTYVAFLVVS